jgi:hypothetical protein
MFRSAEHRRLMLWIASWALLLAALAPALSQVLGRNSPHSWVEVCTSQGSVWLDSETGTPQQGKGGQPAQHLLDHCPYCSLHVPTLGLPPAVSLGVPAPLLPALLPPAFLHVARTAHVWVSAQARAPPSARA